MRRKIKGLVLVFLLAISAVYGQMNLGDLEELDYANPKKYEIGGITISGVKYLDNNVLITLSGLTVGDVIGIPGEEISKAIRNLWDQGLFENVIVSVTNVQGNLVFLNIDLQERPRMSTFAFGGVKKSEADNIRDEIKLASGDVVTDNMIIRTTNTIKGYFTEKGYLDTEVKITQIEDSLRINHVRLQIDIDKKEKVRIQSINISGNTEFDNQKVKKYLKETKEKGSFNPFANLEELIFDIVKDIVTLKFMKVADDVKEYGNENVKLRIFKSSKFIKDKYEEDLVNVIDKYNACWIQGCYDR